MKNFLCNEDQCGKSYSSSHNLKRHKVIKHLRSRSFECSVCLKKLSSAQNLKEHKNIHLNQSPYECALCLARFRYSSQTSKHKKLHQVQKSLNKYSELKVI
jgi:KRAB domain-containing zinc finger protein